MGQKHFPAAVAFSFLYYSTIGLQVFVSLDLQIHNLSVLFPDTKSYITIKRLKELQQEFSYIGF
jgi:hypothetical protein